MFLGSNAQDVILATAQGLCEMHICCILTGPQGYLFSATVRRGLQHRVLHLFAKIVPDISLRLSVARTSLRSIPRLVD